VYSRYVKRALDIAVSGVALVGLSPALVLVSILIYLDDRGSVFFRQRRVGRHEREFSILKFRSMEVGSSNLPSASASNLRITRFGRLIRRTNIDELPQLVNIFRGEMSLVGPRPALASQIELLRIRREGAATEWRPGLTGLAQVCSYTGMDEATKGALDCRYCANVSFLGDLAIIARTFLYLLKPPPVY
jgi:O-antigen biosynthesis protein WbqP